jgi:hypothetical protein
LILCVFACYLWFLGLLVSWSLGLAASQPRFLFDDDRCTADDDESMLEYSNDVYAFMSPVDDDYDVCSPLFCSDCSPFPILFTSTAIHCSTPENTG